MLQHQLQLSQVFSQSSYQGTYPVTASQKQFQSQYCEALGLTFLNALTFE